MTTSLDSPMQIGVFGLRLRVSINDPLFKKEKQNKTKRKKDKIENNRNALSAFNMQ